MILYVLSFLSGLALGGVLGGLMPGVVLGGIGWLRRRGESAVSGK